MPPPATPGTACTLVINVDQDIWPEFVAAKYAPALIEAGASTAPFVGPDVTRIPVTSFTKRSPSTGFPFGVFTIGFNAPEIEEAKYWVGFQSDLEQDVDRLEIKEVAAGDLYTIDGEVARVDHPSTSQRTARPWIPDDGASIGLINTQAGAPLIYQTTMDTTEVTDENAMEPKWALPVYQPGPATIRLPDNKIAKTFFFWTREVGPNGAGLTVEDQTEKTTLTFDAKNPTVTLYYDGSFLSWYETRQDVAKMKHQPRVDMTNGVNKHKLRALTSRTS